MPRISVPWHNWLNSRCSLEGQKNGDRVFGVHRRSRHDTRSQRCTIIRSIIWLPRWTTGEKCVVCSVEIIISQHPQRVKRPCHCRALAVALPVAVPLTVTVSVTVTLTLCVSVACAKTLSLSCACVTVLAAATELAVVPPPRHHWHCLALCL